MPPSIYSILVGIFLVNVLIYLAMPVVIWAIPNDQPLPPDVANALISLNQTFYNVTNTMKIMKSASQGNVTAGIGTIGQFSMSSAFAFTLVTFGTLANILLNLPKINGAMFSVLVTYSGVAQYIPGVDVLLSLLEVFIGFILVLLIASAVMKYNLLGA